ncbi:hypothetical protein [Novosphingobium sp. KA1]|uniref:hypothetical protein n=1 Tax=Novosphingobium sp. (strain KA1) TaxID=164608 RepID=UPI001A8C6057|nr:hypothetical protein [Novosphingobium sp. KA1]QSR19731.1 hypothetical protein CA833_21545 [Novosphingobium sp. KA1]
MPTIPVIFDITLEDEEVTAMAEAIGCTEQQLAGVLPAYAKTALREYADMMIGDSPITTATDLRERRLVGLIKIALGGRMPDAGRVARLFNIAPQGARSLLRSVTAKHRRKLDSAVRNETAAFVAACVNDPATNDWKVTWLNPVLVEMLNDRLENANQSKEPIRRNPLVLGGYLVPNGSYDWIVQNP